MEEVSGILSAERNPRVSNMDIEAQKETSRTEL